MKTLILAIAIVFLSKVLSAQTFTTYADTANYLTSEIGLKMNTYVGQPFSFLYDSLKIKPVRFVNANTSTENFGNRAILYFNYDRSSFSKKHFIIVNFESVPTYNTLYPILYPSTGDADLNTVINTYKPLIIKSYTVKDYSKDEDIDPGILIMKAPKKKK